MISHDRLFKELISTFFVEFLELFVPEFAAHIEDTSFIFLDKEVITDVTSGEVHEADMVVRAKLKRMDSFVLIHTEAQAQRQAAFGMRLFRYFARLSERHNVPIYPIAILSFDSPTEEQPNSYDIELPTLHVLHFQYKVIQLNRLYWRAFLRNSNPVAAALMSKMQFAAEERVVVKLECLRMIAALKLDSARCKLLAGFVDSYLRLTEQEEHTFNYQLAQHQDASEKEVIMEIVTSWMERGVEQGLVQGRAEGLAEGRMEGVVELVTRQLTKRLGVSVELTRLRQLQCLSLEQLEELGVALLDFGSHKDLEDWLSSLATNSAAE